ncbi:ATP-dependent DNA helicase [Trichonephila inaurata madagascariensis]|uniref:ATP-dependent DNA helicase n=1 Tax=Trichonephila inaurata madagascariensis TaxID=2747483 RepID=A0A8X6X9G3_9ARAC|nr:ATP-dependent DNA helicase [Trichonephila inaurata madagascariensis]
MMEMYKERDQQLELALNRAYAFELLNREPEPLYHDNVVELPEEERMNEDQFERAKQTMNVCQREIFVNITRCVQEQLNGSQDRLTLYHRQRRNWQNIPIQASKESNRSTIC